MKIEIKKVVELEAKYLKVDAGVRYWEDTSVNGVDDTDCDETEDSPTIPCAEFIGDQNSALSGKDWRWRPIIDIETGQIINWEEGTVAHVHYKVCDDFSCEILDKESNPICSYDGYVPDIMCPSDDGFGDYIIMSINEEGFIDGWKSAYIHNIVKSINSEDN